MPDSLKTCLRSMALGIVAIAVACGTLQMLVPPAMAAEAAAAPETNPPGDIPDSQVFVLFKSPAGFSVKAPEGWARSERKNGARFTDKFNTVDIETNPASAPPSVASVRSGQAAELARTGRAVRIIAIKKARLPAGPAILIVYESNSEPNPVTDKQLRLESNRYLVFRSGQLATLDLSAPLGADNADQWRLIARSFNWN